MNIVNHITTVHSRYDTRILENQCVHLAKKYNVTLLVTDGKPDENYSGVRITSLYSTKGKFHRLVCSFFKLPFLIKKRKSDIYHFHDPELLLAALLLYFYGCNVVFDVHEDYELDLIQKNWIPKKLRKLTVIVYGLLSNYCFRRFSSVITVTEKIAQKLAGNVTVVKNYPRKELSEKPFSNKNLYKFCYVGSISIKRGLDNLLKVASASKEPFLLIGNFAGAQDKLFFDNNTTKNIDHIGYVHPKKIPYYLSKAQIGLHLVENDVNLLEGIPLKILEYASAGLHIICCDSKSWKEEFSKLPTCNFTRPSDTKKIIKISNEIIKLDKKILKIAQEVVIKDYSWQSQFFKLSNVYSSILSIK